MLILLPLALAVLAPEQQIATVLARDAEARWVDFELTPNNLIRFPVTLGGHAARAILDTGLSDTLVTRAFADTIGLARTGSEHALAIGGEVDIAWSHGATIAFAGLSRSGGRIGIADVPGQERLGADVIVGSDTLGCCAIDIDYDAHRFRILPSGRLPFAGSTAPLARTRRSAVPVSEMVIAGRTFRPIIVDTGDGSALTLTRSAWTALGYRGPVTTTLAWGMGGEIVTDTAVLPAIALGGMPAAAEVRVELANGYSARAGAAGRIGNGFLSRYRVLLDPRAGRMVLRPGARVSEAVPRSTSGLLLEASGETLLVLHVMRGSPAADADIREGDRICFVDGAPVAASPTDWVTGVSGRTVGLGLCDGSERSITLRRFY